MRQVIFTRAGYIITTKLVMYGLLGFLCLYFIAYYEKVLVMVASVVKLRFTPDQPALPHYEWAQKEQSLRMNSLINLMCKNLYLNMRYHQAVKGFNHKFDK